MSSTDTSPTLSREEIIERLKVILITASEAQDWNLACDDVFMLLQDAGEFLSRDPRWIATLQ